MKKGLFFIAHWLYIQLYVTFTVVFASKGRLAQIAHNGGDNPLYVFGIARYSRIWWLTIGCIGFWLFWFWPFINLSLYGELKFHYAEFVHPDAVIFFGMYKIGLAKYWLSGVFGGGLLQLIEITSANKIAHFQRCMQYSVARKSDRGPQQLQKVLNSNG